MLWPASNQPCTNIHQNQHIPSLPPLPPRPPGMLCKKTLGTGDGGLMHITWLEEGPDATRKLINNTQYTVNHWLLHVSGGVGCVGVGVEVGSPKRVAADAGPGPDTPSFAACLCVRVSVRCSAGTPFNVPLLHPACLSLADTLVLPPSPPPPSPRSTACPLALVTRWRMARP